MLNLHNGELFKEIFGLNAEQIRDMSVQDFYSWLYSDADFKIMEVQEQNKCSSSEQMYGPGGFPVDPCVYVEQEVHRNVDVTISKCKYCGSVDISWQRTENTTDEYYSGLGPGDYKNWES